MRNPTLTYRTFDTLLADAQVDLPALNQEGAIEPAQLIKVAQRVNYDLGLKIHQEKTVMLDVQRGRARLPEDFYLLNYATVCLHYRVEQPVITGTQTEDVILDVLPDNTLPCVNDKAPCLTQCGEYMYVKQTFKTETRIYDVYADIRIKPGRSVPNDCRNCHAKGCPNEAEIRDGWLFTNFDCGEVFISYLGQMEDEEGNLLVVDHPGLNDYYEYALKQRILENQYLAGEDVSQRLQLIEARLITARNYAHGIVNTPDFKELKQMWELNRRAMAKRYYSIFY